jgi:hypothetical protein
MSYNSSIELKGKESDFWCKTRLWLLLIVGYCRSYDPLSYMKHFRNLLAV